MNDVVNKDLTRTHLNQYKDEVQKGGKVTVMTRGWVVTSNVTGSPTPGQVAYADAVTKGKSLQLPLLLKHLEAWLLAVGCPTRTQTVTPKSTSTFLTRLR